MYYIRCVAGIAVLVVCVAAGWFSVRLAEADRRFRLQTPESVAQAVRMMPRNTEYAAFRALQLEYDGQNSEPLLRQVAQLNPLASAPRIRLGLAAEARGD